KRVHGRPECRRRSLYFSGALDPRPVRQQVPQRPGVPARGQLRGYEQRGHAAWGGELQGALDERDGEIGKMREATPARGTPRRVARRERFPDLRRQPLAADPGGVAYDDVEPAACDDVSEVRLEREERHAALTAQPPPRPPQLAPAGPQESEQGALRCVEAVVAPEQIAVTGEGKELGDPPLQHPDRVLEQAFAESGFGPGQLGQRAAFGGSSHAEQ